MLLIIVSLDCLLISEDVYANSKGTLIGVLRKASFVPTSPTNPPWN